ncbi:MAG: hypothetical protein QXP54_06265, partial [Thermofilum sp.]
ELRARLGEGERVGGAELQELFGEHDLKVGAASCCGLFQLFSPSAHVQQVPSVAPAHGKH